MTTHSNHSAPSGVGAASVDIRLGGKALDDLGHGIYDLNKTYIDVITRILEIGQHVARNPELMEEFDTQLRHPSNGFSYDVPVTEESLGNYYLPLWADYVVESTPDNVIIPELDWPAYIARFSDLETAIGQYTQIMISWKSVVPMIELVSRLEEKWGLK